MNNITDSKILIAIDLQNGFIKTDYARSKANKIAKLIASKSFDKVIATKFTNYTGSMYEKCFGWSELKTSEQIDLYDQIGAIADETFIKTTYNCVNDKFIELLVKLNNGKLPEQVYLCGLDTDACVLATAIGLFERSITPIVLENYCFSTGGNEYHNAGLKCLERLIGKSQISNYEFV